MRNQAISLSGQLPGFVLLIEGLPCEEINALMNEIHKLIEKIIEHHHGEVKQFSDMSPHGYVLSHFLFV